MRMYTDPKGTAYKELIKYAIQRTSRFMLGVGGYSTSFGDDFEYIQPPPPALLDRLQPYLLEVRRVTQEEVLAAIENEEIPSLLDHGMSGAGEFYYYRCCEASGQILAEAVHGLYDWCSPLPEDLTFLNEDGTLFLGSVAHERMGILIVEHSEGRELMSRIPGLFLELPEHKEFDCYLDDAIRHQTDWLEIQGYGLTELPVRIRELEQLKNLSVFEQDLDRLPSGLFELTGLETLSIMSAELVEIPREIGSLKQLRELRIYGGSSDRPTPSWHPRPKEELPLRSLPAEIGELSRLEYLDIAYSGIRELPPELERLQNLKSLTIANSLMDKKPNFLQRMKSLEYVSISTNPFGIGD
ncbi:Leucine Rich repeats (2 copies) [compost metagenome]